MSNEKKTLDVMEVDAHDVTRVLTVQAVIGCLDDLELPQELREALTEVVRLWELVPEEVGCIATQARLIIDLYNDDNYEARQ